ncbi:MAG: PLP-dependent aminotransferase family protein [Pseudomonadota bacterium]
MTTGQSKRLVEEQDFVKGWPHPSMLERPELQNALSQSFAASISRHAASCLNYGTAEEGAYMLGNPRFLRALSGFLTTHYRRDVDPDTLMSTTGGSMGIDLCAHAHSVPGDFAVCEAPTFYLAHDMFRERGLQLREVPMEMDGMDLDRLERVVAELDGRCKLVYTIPIHHNPTGVSMSQAKRERLAALARQYNFVVIADEAYQLVNFDKGSQTPSPLFYEDDPDDPHIVSVGTFSKLIGPGMKVGWVQAHPALLTPLSEVGFVGSGNNPVIFSSSGLTECLESGAISEHVDFVTRELGRKCEVLCTELRKIGYNPVQPSGGYFVWVHNHRERSTGRSGAGMSLELDDEYTRYMRLCFAWLSDEQIIEGIRFLDQA